MSKVNMYMCLGCGSMGVRDDLVFEVIDVVGPLSEIFKVNSFGKYACPNCRKADGVVFQQHATANVCLKIPAGPIVREEPTPWAPQPKVEIGKGFTSITIPKEAEPVIDEQPPAEVAAEPFRAPPAPEPVRVPPAYSNKCDICQKMFKSKIDGATRCPKCLAETLRSMV